MRMQDNFFQCEWFTLLLFNQKVFNCVSLYVFLICDCFFGVKCQRFCNAYDLVCCAIYVGSADVIVGVLVVSASFQLGLALTLNYTVLKTPFLFFSSFFQSLWCQSWECVNDISLQNPWNKMSKWLFLTLDFLD